MNQENAMDVLPAAQLCHFSKGRVRIRIDRKRGDETYFQRLKKALKTHFDYASIATNPATGSLLIVDRRVAPDDVAAYAREAKLFALHRTPRPDRQGVRTITNPIKALDTQLRRITGGSLDMTSSVFAALVTFGVVELLRGNFRSPPWYTAFWYAFGLFTKTLMDNSEE